MSPEHSSTLVIRCAARRCSAARFSHTNRADSTTMARSLLCGSTQQICVRLRMSRPVRAGVVVSVSEVDTGEQGPQRYRVRLAAVLWTAPVLLVSAGFSWAIIDLSMGHVEDSGGLLTVPIAFAAVAVFLLVNVFTARDGLQARQLSSPLITLGSVSLLILACFGVAVLKGLVQR